MWAHMCYENKGLSKSILNLLGSRRSADMYHINTVLNLLSYQFEIIDSLTELRFNLISEVVGEVFRAKQDHFGSTSSYYEKIMTSLFLQRVSSTLHQTYLRKQNFRTLCFSNDNLLKLMDNFLLTASHPPVDSNFTRRVMAV